MSAAAHLCLGGQTGLLEFGGTYDRKAAAPPHGPELHLRPLELLLGSGVELC